jgi:peptidoglycan/LPS O-acetylase OafA/YrhL
MNVKSSPQIRRYDLDWLRVLAILSVFVYHSTRFFNLGDWHVKNANLYLSVQIFEEFMENWMMPLIFVISGAAIFFALGKGGALKFVKDKVLRLLVPLVVADLTHATLQVYLEKVTHGEFSGSYFQFLPHIFDGIYLDIGSSGNFPFAGMHLWYLLVLFIFSLLCYPVFRLLKGPGKGVLKVMGDILAFPGAMYLLLALPLVVMESLTGDTFFDEVTPGGWSFPLYLIFFIGGFILISNDRLQERVRSSRWISLALGLAILGIYLVMRVRFYQDPAYGPTFEQWNDILASLSSWSLILGFMGLAREHLCFTNPFLRYSNEAVLPFYILHQTVLLSVGYFVVRWPIPDFIKWLVIAAVSFALIMGVYEYLIRRSNILRFLFGMKVKEPERETAPIPQAARS